MTMTKTSAWSTFLSDLDKHAGAVQAVSSLLIVVLTLAYILYSRVLAREAIATRRAQDNPYVLVTLDSARVQEVRSGAKSFPASVGLQLWNGGRGPAKNISVEIVGSASYETNALAFLGAGEKIKITLNVRQLTASTSTDPTDEQDIVVRYLDLFDASWSCVLRVGWKADPDDERTGLELSPGMFSVTRPR